MEYSIRLSTLRIDVVRELVTLETVIGRLADLDHSGDVIVRIDHDLLGRLQRSLFSFQNHLDAFFVKHVQIV